MIIFFFFDNMDIYNNKNFDICNNDIFNENNNISIFNMIYKEIGIRNFKNNCFANSFIQILDILNNF